MTLRLSVAMAARRFCGLPASAHEAAHLPNCLDPEHARVSPIPNEFPPLNH